MKCTADSLRNESMPTTQIGSMDVPLSKHIRNVAPHITMIGLLMTALVFGLDPYWILTGSGNSNLSPTQTNSDSLCKRAIRWYKDIWNIVIEELGNEFLHDCQGLTEADIAEYANGKNILITDFIEFIETEIDLKILFRCSQ